MSESQRLSTCQRCSRRSQGGAACGQCGFGERNACSPNAQQGYTVRRRTANGSLGQAGGGNGKRHGDPLWGPACGSDGQRPARETLDKPERALHHLFPCLPRARSRHDEPLGGLFGSGRGPCAVPARGSSFPSYDAEVERSLAVFATRWRRPLPVVSEHRSAGEAATPA
jgi:hypothetical protein